MLEGKGIASHIRGEINSLKDYIPQINSDIEQFNSHAKLLIKKLNRLGEETNDDDFLISLLNSYLAAQDDEFVKYVADRKSEHDDGRRELTPTRLMEIASSKFKLLKTTGKWQAPTPTQKEIAALQSKVEKLIKKHPANDKKQENRFTKNMKDPGSKPYEKSNPREPKAEKPSWLTQNKPPSKGKLKEARDWNGTDW